MFFVIQVITTLAAIGYSATTFCRWVLTFQYDQDLRYDSSRSRSFLLFDNRLCYGKSDEAAERSRALVRLINFQR